MILLIIINYIISSKMIKDIQAHLEVKKMLEKVSL